MSWRLITRFADDMARELEANSHKDGWDTMGTRRLLVRAEQEMGELRRAIEKGKSFEDIRSEAADGTLRRRSKRASQGNSPAGLASP